MTQHLDPQSLDPRRLADTHTFRQLTPETVAAIVSQATVKLMEKGEPLFQAGDAYKHTVFIVYDGNVEMRRADGSILRQGPGSILGLANYLDKEPYTATAASLDKTTVLTLHEHALGQLEQHHPDLFDTLNRIVSDRLRHRSRLRHRISGTLGKPVSRVMKSPLACCQETDSLRHAFMQMRQGNIGSLGVLDNNGQLIGVLTYASLAKALLHDPTTADAPIARAMLESPVIIPPTMPLWQAEELQLSQHLKYLIVAQDHVPLGVISQTDILRAVSAHQHILFVDIRDAVSIEDLQALHKQLPIAAREIWESHRRATQAVRVITDIHLALQRRCVELTLHGMREEGKGTAPRPYAVLIMGSGGRGEMLMNPDQDNGVIIDNGDAPLNPEEERWFEVFAQRLNTNLDIIGYPLCQGDIMACNPMFRKTLHQWQDKIRYLVDHPNEKAARWSNIVFDFVALPGGEGLTETLRGFLLQEISAKPTILEFMTEHDYEGRPALGIFNRLLTADDKNRKGKIDIKRNGLRIVCDAARIYALSAGITATNTIERLNGLVHQGVLSSELVTSVSLAFEEMLDLLLAHQLSQAEHKETVDNLIDPSHLSTEVRSTLRMAMRTVKRFQEHLQGRFGREAF
jgi:CBS domain-containing protein